MKKVIHGILIGVAAATLSIITFLSGSLDWLENKTWDARVEMFARPGTDTDQVRVVLIDQTSLDWAKKEMNLPWPWPRQLYFPIIHACTKGGAKAFAFDLILTEPSSHNVNMENSDDDIVLGSAISDAQGIVSAVVLSREQGLQTNWPDNLNLNNFPVPGMDTYTSSPPGSRLVLPRASFPIDQVTTNTHILGAVFAVQDEDAIIRRSNAFQVFDNHFIPSLGLATYIVTQPSCRIEIKENILTVDGKSIPLDSAGSTILKYRGPTQTHMTINAAKVMRAGIKLLEGKDPEMDLSIFKDTYVLLGVGAPGFKDLRPIPLQRNYPGVEIHATMLDNLLSNDFMRDAPLYISIILTCILSIAAGLAIRLLSKGVHAAIAAFVLMAIPLCAGVAGYAMGYWLPVALPGMAVFLSIASSVIVNYAIEGRQKRFIKSAFSQYLSPHVIERLVNNPDHLSLGGEARVLTIMFSDVAGFTSISEALTPEDLTALLNDYLTAMTDIIMEEGGTIDKYEGDAIIAFWNAPLDIPDHAERAVRAALKCQKKLFELNVGFKERAGRDLTARIGINTGKVVVGNMGSTQRFDYTFLGDAGNLASRLEGINKQFGTNLMISEYTLKETGSKFKVRELSRVQVVGRAKPVVVYEPMLDETFESQSETLSIFAEALKNYYDGKFKEAEERFKSIADQDPPAKAYARKCQYLQNNPPDKWNAVWTMTEK